jgi:hypothetical protein
LRESEVIVCLSCAEKADILICGKAFAYKNAPLIKTAHLLFNSKNQEPESKIETLELNYTLFCANCGTARVEASKFCGHCGKSDTVTDKRYELAKEILSNEMKYAWLLDVGLNLYLQPLIREMEFYQNAPSEYKREKKQFGNYSFMSGAFVTAFAFQQVASIHDEFIREFEAEIQNYTSKTCFGYSLIKLMQIVSFLYDEYQESIESFAELLKHECFFDFFQERVGAAVKDPSILIDPDGSESVKSVDFFLRLPIRRIRQYVYILQTYLDLVTVNHPDFPLVFKAAHTITPLDQELLKKRIPGYGVPQDFLEKFKRHAKEEKKPKPKPEIDLSASFKNVMNLFVKKPVEEEKSKSPERSRTPSSQKLVAKDVFLHVKPELDEKEEEPVIRMCRKCNSKVSEPYCSTCGKKRE